MLVSVDTLRADHLPAYGYRDGHTPALERFAADAIRFDQHFANASFTALNLFRLEERDEAIIADQSRQERVSSIRSLKSYKHHRFILNLFISRLALSRDNKNLEAVIEEVSRVGAVAA